MFFFFFGHQSKTKQPGHTNNQRLFIEMHVVYQMLENFTLADSNN